MPTHNKAQVTLEYAIIAMLVISGILLMGPYTIRSINAFFETFDSESRESFEEDLRQAPNPFPDFEIPACDCPPLAPGQCGNGSNCPFIQRVWETNCSPAGCEVALRAFGQDVQTIQCRDDHLPPDDTNACCDNHQSTGLCGINGVNAPGGKCDDGEMQWSKECGSARTVVYYCDPDPNCVFQCLGGALDPNATWCEIPPEFELPQDLPTTYVHGNWPLGGACDGTKCQAQCADGYEATGAGCLLLECGDGRLTPQLGEVCEPVNWLPYGVINPGCRGCGPSYQICTDNCQTVGYNMNVHSYFHATWRNVPHFSIVGSQWWMDVNCRLGLNFFWHTNPGFCERGTARTCIAGAAGTPYCRMYCWNWWNDRNGAQWNFVCR